MLVPWKEQKSTERVFLLQQMKPAFPPGLMPRTAQPLCSLSPSQSFPPLFYTFCPFCDGSSLPLHVLSKASRHWGLPWGTSGTLSLDFTVQSGSPVLWVGTLMLSPSPSEQWPHSLFWLSTKNESFRPLDFNQTYSWKCLMAVFKISLHNPYRQDVTCVNANEI